MSPRLLNRLPLLLLTVVFSSAVWLTLCAPARAAWQVQRSGVTRTLNAVDFLDARHGWAAGNRGVVLRTSDGGATWQRATLPPTEHLTDICFVSATRGWVVGDGGTVWRSDDGGRTWQRQRRGSWRGALHAAVFTDPQHGCIAGGSYMYGRIWTTSDGGRTWKVRYKSGLYDIRALSFVDGRRGWALGRWGDEGAFDCALLRTTDGGVTWRRQVRWRSFYLDNPIWPSSLCFVDDQRGWLCGEGCALTTTDGGQTWTRRYRGVLNLSAVSSPDFEHAWLAEGDPYGGTRGRVLATDDAGTTWTTRLTGNRTSLNDLDFISAAQGWAVGAGGRIFVWR